MSRYRLAKREQASANPPEWPKGIIARQDAYWRSEANMAEGNPMLALERGEKVATPPALWIQSTNDLIHDYHDPESDFPGSEAQRFVRNYRKAGGEIVLEYYDAPLHFTTEHPTMPQSIAAMARVVAFVHEQMPVKI